MTHRQFRAWQRWQALQWNRPARSDHYAMQIACSIARVLAKNPREIQPDHFRLTFSQKSTAVAPVSQEDVDRQVQIDKARWSVLLGKKIPHTTLAERDPFQVHIEDT